MWPSPAYNLRRFVLWGSWDTERVRRVLQAAGASGEGEARALTCQCSELVLVSGDARDAPSAKPAAGQCLK
jgi:hypothetical protein